MLEYLDPLHISDAESQIIRIFTQNGLTYDEALDALDNYMGFIERVTGDDHISDATPEALRDIIANDPEFMPVIRLDGSGA